MCVHVCTHAYVHRREWYACNHLIVQAGVYVDEYVCICGECRVQCTHVYWTCLYSAVPHEALDTVIQDLWELGGFVALGSQGCF